MINTPNASRIHAIRLRFPLILVWIHLQKNQKISHPTEKGLKHQANCNLKPQRYKKWCGTKKCYSYKDPNHIASEGPNEALKNAWIEKRCQKVSNLSAAPANVRESSGELTIHNESVNVFTTDSVDPPPFMLLPLQYSLSNSPFMSWKQMQREN